MDTSPRPNSPVFRTGSEPTLSPALVRRVSSDARAGEALRGSDSQLCPKPPPKPCKAPLLQPPPSPSTWLNSEANYCELNPAFATGGDRGARPPLCAHDSYVELLTAKQNGVLGPRHSGTNYLILDDDGAGPGEAPATQMDQGQQEDEGEFVLPRLETASSFRPNDFESKLLPAENKPLEMAMLKRVKELFTSKDPKAIAQHMLSTDCMVSAQPGGLVLPSERLQGGGRPCSTLPFKCFAHRRSQKITWVGIYLKGGKHRPGTTFAQAGSL